MRALNEPVARRRKLQAATRAVVGIPLADPGGGETLQYPRSTDEIRRLVGLGYRPIGPVGWEKLSRGGFLPPGETYLGGKAREDDEI